MASDEDDEDELVVGDDDDDDDLEPGADPGAAPSADRLVVGGDDDGMDHKHDEFDDDDDDEFAPGDHRGGEAADDDIVEDDHDEKHHDGVPGMEPGDSADPHHLMVSPVPDPSGGVDPGAAERNTPPPGSILPRLHHELYSPRKQPSSAKTPAGMVRNVGQFFVYPVSPNSKSGRGGGGGGGGRRSRAMSRNRYRGVSMSRRSKSILGQMHHQQASFAAKRNVLKGSIWKPCPPVAEGCSLTIPELLRSPLWSGLSEADEIVAILKRAVTAYSERLTQCTALDRLLVEDLLPSLWRNDEEVSQQHVPCKNKSSCRGAAMIELKHTKAVMIQAVARGMKENRDLARKSYQPVDMTLEFCAAVVRIEKVIEYMLQSAKAERRRRSRGVNDELSSRFLDAGSNWLYALAGMDSEQSRAYGPTNELITDAIKQLSTFIEPTVRAQHRLLRMLASHPYFIPTLATCVTPDRVPYSDVVGSGSFVHLFREALKVRDEAGLPTLTIVSRFDVRDWLAQDPTNDQRAEMFELLSRSLREAARVRVQADVMSSEELEARRTALIEFLCTSVEHLGAYKFPDMFHILFGNVLEGSRAGDLPTQMWSMLSRLPLEQLRMDQLQATVRTLQKYFTDLRHELIQMRHLPSALTIHSVWKRSMVPFWEFVCALFVAFASVIGGNRNENQRVHETRLAWAGVWHVFSPWLSSEVEIELPAWALDGRANAWLPHEEPLAEHAIQAFLRVCAALLPADSGAGKAVWNRYVNSLSYAPVEQLKVFHHHLVGPHVDQGLWSSVVVDAHMLRDMRELLERYAGPRKAKVQSISLFCLELLHCCDWRRSLGARDGGDGVAFGDATASAYCHELCATVGQLVSELTLPVSPTALPFLSDVLATADMTVLTVDSYQLLLERMSQSLYGQKWMEELAREMAPEGLDSVAEQAAKKKKKSKKHSHRSPHLPPLAKVLRAFSTRVIQASPQIESRSLQQPQQQQQQQQQGAAADINNDDNDEDDEKKVKSVAEILADNGSRVYHVVRQSQLQHAREEKERENGQQPLRLRRRQSLMRLQNEFSPIEAVIETPEERRMYVIQLMLQVARFDHVLPDHHGDGGDDDSERRKSVVKAGVSKLSLYAEWMLSAFHKDGPQPLGKPEKYAFFGAVVLQALERTYQEAHPLLQDDDVYVELMTQYVLVMNHHVEKHETPDELLYLFWTASSDFPHLAVHLMDACCRSLASVSTLPVVAERCITAHFVLHPADWATVVRVFRMPQADNKLFTQCALQHGCLHVLHVCARQALARVRNETEYQVGVEQMLEWMTTTKLSRASENKVLLAVRALFEWQAESLRRAEHSANAVAMANAMMGRLVQFVGKLGEDAKYGALIGMLGLGSSDYSERFRLAMRSVEVFVSLRQVGSSGKGKKMTFEYDWIGSRGLCESVQREKLLSAFGELASSKHYTSVAQHVPPILEFVSDAKHTLVKAADELFDQILLRRL
eukprot:TRINITY_DN65849_c7_g4_i1.p1 TRINITY_DN65849_c7_g4~~TRINITY_DN65849_c7_g4_i1.p1  ORF type:complete len:1519 (-),score=849.25 TRINITY_DN65849_c7_g4_i1:58-4479(-)